MADLSTFDYDEENLESGVDVRMEASVVMTWRCLGPHAVRVEEVTMVKEVCEPFVGICGWKADFGDAGWKERDNRGLDDGG